MIPVLLPNPWDPGSAKLFAALGFRALATTSGGFAATLGRLDGSVTRDEALRHAAQIVDATDLPVSADLENGFVDDPEDVAETVRLAVDTGLAGCSIEDFTGQADDPIYEPGLAAERVQAAAEAAHAANPAFVLTARCEQYLHGRADLDSTIARLQSFQAAGADALYAPGAGSPGDIQSIVSSTDLPVNVLAMPGPPRCSSWVPSESAGYRWAARSTWWRSPPRPTPPVSSSTTALTASGRRRVPGMQLVHQAFA